MEVPEFPQSRAAPGSMQQASPALDRHAAVGGPLHAGTHRLDRGQGGGHVRPVGEAVDHRGALGQGGEEHGAVRDRLLPRGPDRPLARHAAPDDQDAGGGHDSLSARQWYPWASMASRRRSASAVSTTRIRTPRGPSAEWAISMS